MNAQQLRDALAPLAAITVGDHWPDSFMCNGVTAGAVRAARAALADERSVLFNTGEFRLHAGQRSDFKIDCDALTDDDLAMLAQQVAKRFWWSKVHPILSGGARFAAMLDAYSSPVGPHELPVLIVDDVYTTGQSMRAIRTWYPAADDVIGVVIFARNEPQEEWVHALFQMWPARPVEGEEPDGA